MSLPFNRRSKKKGAEESSSPPPVSTVNLASNDGSVFPVKVEVARRFGLCRDMMDLNIIGVTDSEPVPLSNISGPILRLVITWAEGHQARHPIPINSKVKEEEEEEKPSTNDAPQIYYKAIGSSSTRNDSPPREPKRTMDDLEYWDQQFLGSLSLGELQDLLIAASYLDSQELLESICKIIAQMIKGELELNGPKQVASFLGIPQESSPKEGQKKKAETTSRVTTESSNQPNTHSMLSVSTIINNYKVQKVRKNKQPVRAKAIKSEDEEPVRWVGVVFPEK